jgi:hypothetical protein
MKRLAALLAIAVALGATSLAPVAAAREEGPIEIDKCQTISHPGSYKLVNNLTLSGPGACLTIAADFVTIDLAGFTIEGRERGILALPSSSTPLQGIAVRNGSIVSSVGVDLGSAIGSIVEGLRVVAPGGRGTGIIANGIVKGNIAFGEGAGAGGAAIEATGIVTGNYVLRSRNVGISIGEGSTVIGNTVTAPFSLEWSCLVPLT